MTVVEARTVVVEREVPFPLERIWRALTQPHLIEEWLMKNDFLPVVGRGFQFQAAWGVIDCEVRTVEPNRSLAYSWAARGLDSVVTWTLTPTGGGTHLRIEQTGFGPDQELAFRGATAGWPRFLDSLEQLLARAE